MLPFLKRGLWTACVLVTPLAVLAEPAALAVGNGDYENYRDVARADDLGDLERRLAEGGFIASVETNADDLVLRRALQDFADRAGSGTGAVALLSGRFVHSSTESYFLPADSEVSSLEAARREGLPLSTLTAMLAASPGRAVLALGDGGSFALDVPLLAPGVGEVRAPQGVTVLSGAPEDVRAVLSAVVRGEPVLSSEALEASGVAVMGFVPSSGRIVFADAAPAAPDPREAELGFWEAVRALDLAQGYDAYLARYPRGIYAAEARQRIAALRDAPRREAEEGEAALRLNRDQRREIQRALTLLGYDTRGIDGIFGPGTRGAISAFEEGEGFEVTGYLDREEIRRLDTLARARAAELEEEARLEAERRERDDREFWRATGASGREADLRRYLDRYPDGVFADEARDELRAIEEARRPPASAVEELTWRRVEENGSADAYREYLRRYPDGTYAETARREIARLEAEAGEENDREAAQRGEAAMNLSSTTRRTIEQRLEALGYDPGPADGTFDERTRRALLRYQEERRLPATGYMNDATMVRILADTVISIFD